MAGSSVTDVRRVNRRATPLGTVLMGFVVAVVAAAVPGAGGVPGISAAADLAPAAPALLGSTTQYQDALQHVGDPNRFAPGGRVEVPFQPRPGDAWQVSGRAPIRLPAGRASGAQLAAVGRLPTVTMAAAPRGVTRALPPSSTAIPAPRAADMPVPLVVRPRVSTGLRRQVFGFLPYWELTDSSAVLDYSLLSTIAYFSVSVDSSGRLVKTNTDGSVSTGWGGWTSAQLTTVMNQAHQAGTRVVLSLTMFAWSSGEAAKQAAMLGSPTARATLATQAAAAVRDRGADGINLDFEPIASGHAADFSALVHSIRAALDAIGPGYQLTFDTTAEGANYPLETATGPGAADAVFVMGYDYRTASAPKAGSIAPLNGPLYNLTTTVQAFLARIPASRIILGIPYYGRAWSTSSGDANAKTISGSQYAASAAVPYANAVDVVAANGRRYDSIEHSPWTAFQNQKCATCPTAWRELYYDDAQSLGRKYDMVNSFGIAGVGMWALGYDGSRPELYQVLADKFLNDTTPPAAGIVAMAATATAEAFPVTWTVVDDWSGVTSADVQVSIDGGPWTDWLTGTTATSGIYPGVDGHGYAFRVRATDGKGNSGAWDVASVFDAAPTLAPGSFARTIVDGLNVRAGPDPAAQRLTSLAPGALVAITGGPIPAGGYTWYQVTEPVLEWNTVAPVLVGVWVAGGDATTPFLVPARAPNTTLVSAEISGLAFGDPPVPAGTPGVGAAVSPNGDGVQDTIAITWTNRSWISGMSLQVAGQDGTPLGSIGLPNAGAGLQSFEWDGRLNGVPLPDATYLVQLVGSGPNGMVSAPALLQPSVGPANPWGIRVDTQPPTLAGPGVGAGSFSPNGDGRRDSLSVSATTADGAHWTVEVSSIVDGAPGDLLRTMTGSGPVVAAAWDGRSDLGVVVPDGSYRLVLTVSDAAGNRAQQSADVAVDTRPATVVPALSPDLISPNLDGAAEKTTLSWTSDEPTAGRLALMRGSRSLRSWPLLVSAAGSVPWDGRDGSGRVLADGRYTLRLTLLDGAGNPTVTSIPVAVDRTAGFLRWSAARFSPKLAQRSTVSFRLVRPAVTTLVIAGPDGRAVRTAWRNRSQAAGAGSWSWDGLGAARRKLAPGRYVATLTVRSGIGTAILLRTVIVR